MRPIPLAPEHWRIEAGEHRFGEHLGRPALHLNGGVATALGMEAVDGVVEVDVALTPERAFPGLLWRGASAEDFESFFVRPHRSGNPDATQYTPVFNGVMGWQLYHGERYTVPLSYRFEGWTRLRVAFAGPVAEVHVDGSAEPVLRVEEQKRGPARGAVGILDGGLGGSWFAGFAVSGEAPRLRGPARRSQPPTAGAVRTWQVSDPFPEAALDGHAVLPPEIAAGRSWTRLEAEPPGLVDLARAHGVEGENNTVLARATISCDEPRAVRLELGFSDRARLFLNGCALFAADDSYRSRDYRFLGSIGWWDAVWLPLQAGENELVVAVSETFGGWGLQARFPDPGGVRASA